MTDAFVNHAAQDLRLVLLRTLIKQPGFRANEVVLQREAVAFGHSRSRDAIRSELRYLEEVGALSTEDAMGYLVATLTRRGHEHVDGLSVIEGVARPSPRG